VNPALQRTAFQRGQQAGPDEQGRPDLRRWSYRTREEGGTWSTGRGWAETDARQGRLKDFGPKGRPSRDNGNC
jgi:hypothetical protein